MTPDAGWSVVGMGNLAGDAQVDLLLMYTDGSLEIWQMDGATRVQRMTPSPSTWPNSNWFVAALYDMNEDGQTDILWQNVTGDLRIWYMTGTTMTATELLVANRTNDPSWRVIGTRYVDADNHLDLVWYHPEGWLQAWYMNGATRLDFGYLTPEQVTDVKWRVTALPNLTGNPLDLVWVHGVDGWFQAWDLNGAVLIDSVWLIPPQLATSWRIVGSFTR